MHRHVCSRLTSRLLLILAATAMGGRIVYELERVEVSVDLAPCIFMLLPSSAWAWRK